MRAATAAEPSGSSPPIERGRRDLRQHRTQRSIRSRSGPETRPVYAPARRGHIGTGPARLPAKPHGHGFIAATSWKRAGNVVARPTRATDDAPVLERLAERLEDVPRELRQLVEEQHAVIRERDLARATCAARHRPSPRRTACGAGDRNGAGDGSGAGGAAPATEATIVAASASASSSGGSSRGIVRARSVLPEPGGPTSSRPWPPASATSRPRRASSWPRTSARSGAGGHGSRRAGRRRGRAAAAVRAVARRDRRAAAPAARADARRRRTSSTASRERRHADGSIPAASRASSTDVAGTIDPPDAAPRERRRPSAGCPGPAGPPPPSESSPISADPTRRRPDLLGPEEDPHRDREVERGAGLALLGGREVDGDPPRRVDEARVPDRAADPLAGLLQRGVRQADDREARQAARDVDLDPDHAPVEADDRGGQQRCKHAPDRTRGRSTAAHPPLHLRLSGTRAGRA